MSIILYILSIHFIADFVMQNDWMALGKSKKFLPLATHCLVYGLTFGLITQLWIWTLINTILHFIVDFITSRINSRLWEAKQVHYFFVSVGFDQLLHYICLIMTFYWMYS